VALPMARNLLLWEIKDLASSLMTSSTTIIITTIMKMLHYLHPKLKESLLIYIRMALTTSIIITTIIKITVMKLYVKAYLKVTSLSSGRDLQAGRKSLTRHSF
jgi:hypothetical protein